MKNLYLFPDSPTSATGSPATVATPSSKPSSTRSQFRVDMPKPPPANVLAQKFTLEQLPSLSEDEGGQVFVDEKPLVTKKESTVADSGSGGSILSSEAAGGEEQPTVATGGQRAPSEKEVQGGEMADQGDKKEIIEDKPTGINKFLKPPKGKEGTKVEDKGTTTKQIVPPNGKVLDLKNYTPEQQVVLKKMAKEAQEYTVKLIDENRELSKLKGSNYLQHPEAYVLDPQFKEIQLDATLAGREAQHYAQQLELCKQGKPVKAITAWKDGQPVYSNEIQPTDSLEEELRLARQQAMSVAQSKQQQLNQFPQKYQSQIQNDMKIVRDKQNELFGWRTDAKLMDYEIPIDGKDISIRNIINSVVNMFPVYMRNNPAVEIVGDMMVALRIRDAELADAQANHQVASTKLEEASSVEFSSKTKPPVDNSKAIGGVKKFKIDDTLEGL